MSKFTALAALAFSLAISSPANASTLIITLPEFNGDGTIANTFIGTFNYVIPVGEVIVSADFLSSFGNSTVSSTATGYVTVDGVTVANCAGPGNFCWDTGPESIAFSFLASDFGLLADGSANLFYNQTDCCVIRLGQSTLTIETRTLGAVPEPSTWAMMLLGFGAMGVSLRRRRRTHQVLQTA